MCIMPGGMQVWGKYYKEGVEKFFHVSFLKMYFFDYFFQLNKKVSLRSVGFDCIDKAGLPVLLRKSSLAVSGALQ